MSDMSLSTMALMERYLDLAAMRQNLISQNLAQIDTPGYKTQDIPFEQQMFDLVMAAEADPSGQDWSTLWSEDDLRSQEVEGLSMRLDQNNVDIDREMTAMASNTARFAIVSQLLSMKLRLLKTSINEGGA